jgi:acetolactate synthase-1/2/3 large subunit
VNAAAIIVDRLIDHGVDTLFGIPGAQTYALFDALAQRKKDIRLVIARHEQGAAYMAYGYAKSTGRPGVYCVVPGPGVLNTTAALATAHNAPVLCITGQVPSEFLGVGHGMLHELPDQLNTLRTLTKWAARINYPSEAATLVDEAFRNMLHGSIKPVALEIPMDVLAQTGGFHSPGPLPSQSRLLPQSGRVEQAVDLIRQAKKPMIYVGSGAVGAASEILDLAKKIQAPVASFRGGRGIVGDDTPYGFNCASGYKYYPDIDLMIGIGTRLELPAFRWQAGVANHNMIRIDTDPTQSVRLRGDVAIVADAQCATSAILAALEDFKPSEQREELFISIKEESNREIQKIQPQMTYLNIMREVLPRESFVVEEISQFGFASYYGFDFYEPRKLVTCGYQGNLGHGFQTSLGVRVANPECPVVSITGDGGFMFGIGELATAVQHGIGIIVLVFNNNAYGNVRRDQIDFYEGRVHGSELVNPDFVALAESFGAQGRRAESPDEFAALLKQALQEISAGPVLIEVPIERGSEASPFEFMMPNNYGR